MNQNGLQNDVLNTLRKQGIQSSIFLTSGVKLVGTIESFDNHTLWLRGKNNLPQLIYKHAVATVLPEKEIVIPNKKVND